MRVLHIHKGHGISGSERHLLSLLPALRERGIEVVMCALVEAPGGAGFTDAFRSVGLDVHEVAATRDLSPRAVTGILRVIRSVQPDLVHTHLVHADVHGLIAAALAHVPAVSSMHDPPPFFDRWQSRWAERFAGRLARRRIAISHDVERVILAKGLGRRGRVDVIHYGIDTARWSGRDRATARAALDIADEGVLVGIASRMVPGKGHDELLDALEIGLVQAPDLRVAVAGLGPLQAHLAARSARLPHGTVRYLGFIDDMAQFMAACDIVAFPTTAELSEGFGLVGLEAMAAARPVIATAVGPVPEVIDDACGILVPAGSTTALADALVRLAVDADLRTRMGAAGEQRANAFFSLATMVDRTVSVYERVLAERGA